MRFTIALLPGTALLAATLAGCSVQPEARLQSGLERAGLSPPLARCMAHRMAKRLSIAQLRQLATLERGGKPESKHEFLRRVEALNDPEIVTVTATAAGLCAAGIAH